MTYNDAEGSQPRGITLNIPGEVIGLREGTLDVRQSPSGSRVVQLERSLELHRARLDATTRAILAVEAADDDPECTLVNRRDLDTALGVARRNREDLELGDDI